MALPKELYDLATGERQYFIVSFCTIQVMQNLEWGNKS